MESITLVHHHHMVFMRLPTWWSSFLMNQWFNYYVRLLYMYLLPFVFCKRLTIMFMYLLTSYYSICTLWENNILVPTKRIFLISRGGSSETKQESSWVCDDVTVRMIWIWLSIKPYVLSFFFMHAFLCKKRANSKSWYTLLEDNNTIVIVDLSFFFVLIYTTLDSNFIKFVLTRSRLLTIYTTNFYLVLIFI